MSKLLRHSALLAAILLAGCDQASSPPPAATGQATQPSAAVSMRAVQPATGAALSAAAALRGELPEAAYAYLRIPNLWGTIGVPTGGVLDKAIGSAPFQAAMQGIRGSLGKTVVAEVPDEEAQALMRLLLLHSNSPIELALLPAPQPGTPLPLLLLTTQVDFADANAFNQGLTEAANQLPQLEITTPVAADGSGAISWEGIPCQVQLDKAPVRLYMACSPFLAEGDLAAVRATLQPNKHQLMQALEQEIDAGGQGFYLWMNPPKLSALAMSSGASSSAMAPLVGMAAVKNMGVGMGTSGGTQRLKVVVEMPAGGMRGFVPVMASTPTVQAAGMPHGVVVMGLPSSSDLTNIEANIALLSPKAMQNYQQFKQEFAAKLGFSFEDIFATFGQDFSIIADEAGEYAALRLKNPEKFQALLTNATEKLGFKHEQREIGGHTYHHLIMPTTNALMGEELDGMDQPETKLIMRFMMAPGHLYWVQEGEYLLMASLPQVLIDRNYISQRTPIDQWLKKQQRMDASGALLLASMRLDGVPAFMYRMNLELLGFLGDLVEQPVDMFALPTAREAGLPQQGAYSLKFTSNESRLGFEIAFESNPMEILASGGSAGGIAAVGILAAVAIPAYQDYTLRVEVNAAVTDVAPVRDYIERFAEANNRYPTSEEIEQLDLSDFVNEKYSVSLSADDGNVIIDFTDPKLSESADLDEQPYLVFSPQATEDGMEWICSDSGMASKYLPASCR